MYIYIMLPRALTNHALFLRLVRASPLKRTHQTCRISSNIPACNTIREYTLHCSLNAFFPALLALDFLRIQSLKQLGKNARFLAGTLVPLLVVGYFGRVVAGKRDAFNWGKRSCFKGYDAHTELLVFSSYVAFPYESMHRMS